MNNLLPISIESGKKRAFACAIDWPGWCRSGRDETAAIQVLLDYAPRYARILAHTGIAFEIPGNITDFLILERHPGSTSTDFGAPDSILNTDHLPLGEPEFERMRVILQACWQAFDRAVEKAWGQELSTGPRGGGRSLDRVLDHALQADLAYLSRLAWKHRLSGNPLLQEIEGVRQAIGNALESAIQGNMPLRGPRGGTYWTPRYFIRRVAWHIVDHAWEIEDRNPLTELIIT